MVVVVAFATALGLRARVEAETPPHSERRRPGVATNIAGPEVRSNKAACCLYVEMMKYKCRRDVRWMETTK